MEVWFQNDGYGEIPVVGHERTIANTGFPLHRYDIIPADVISVRNAPLLHKMSRFNTFRATDYGIISVTNSDTIAFTVRTMSCLVTVRVRPDIISSTLRFHPMIMGQSHSIPNTQTTMCSGRIL